MKSLIYCLLAITFASAVTTIQLPTKVSESKIGHAAFANLIDESLIISTFDGTPFFGWDAVWSVNAQSLLKGAVKPTRIEGSITWPNTASKAPASLFGQDGIVVAGGFLVPGKSDGGLWFSAGANGTFSKLVKFFSGAKGFFYHKVYFYDVNQDGSLDILTCRATKPGGGAAGYGDLVWLKPAIRSSPITGGWIETIIGKGCDTLFIMEDIDGDGVIDIASAEFWGQKLTLIKGPGGKFDNFSELTITTIDATIGNVFDLSFVDLNGDGKKDILASNHDGTGKGGVFGYEQKDTWIRHNITVGFEVLNSGQGQASPGSAQAFYPDSSVKEKPSLVVAGDASQKAYILTPNSNDPQDWEYSRTVLHDCQCTVGSIAVGDVNFNGKADIFVPCYEKGYLATYSYI